MPLRDHFRPPLSTRCPWRSLHSSWASEIVGELNSRWLPGNFFALEHVHVSPQIEIDVGTLESPQPATPPSTNGSGAGTATLPSVWAPPAAPHSFPAVFPESFEIRVFTPIDGTATLVAAVELISPSNKDRPAERSAFVAKCLSYLGQGVSLVIVDVVTERRANLHNLLLDGMPEAVGGRFPDDVPLYAVGYRPVTRGGEDRIECWPERCAVGEELPTLPLRLIGDRFVPIELGLTYEQAASRHRLG